ncbi:hypothetical protein GO495_14685 [Chitinophaga oryziterrae]|uniref:HTH LytTR-type domain-containing protein n=2 Tax=Chitinophaga oryziterrae TaxID=1031224 RepID=A0A6N8JA50_9BACT|nr:hypothetical protein [Chitinophaga oryziterrae]
MSFKNLSSFSLIKDKEDKFPDRYVIFSTYFSYIRIEYYPQNTMHQDFFLQISTKLLVKINSSEICYIETENQFSKIITDTAIHRVYIALYRLESLLPEDLFCRVNRSSIVSICKISKIGEEAVFVKEREIYISKKCRNELITRIKVIG